MLFYPKLSAIASIFPPVAQKNQKFSSPAAFNAQTNPLFW
jgi:hypothetical protein